MGVRSPDGIADLGMTKPRTHLEQHPQGDRAARIAGTMPFGHRRRCIERELAVGDQYTHQHSRHGIGHLPRYDAVGSSKARRLAIGYHEPSPTPTHLTEAP